MTEAEWLACDDPQAMLTFLRGRYDDRKWRLYACGCCRAAWHLLTGEESRRVVEVAERYAEGGETAQALAEAHRQSRGAASYGDAGASAAVAASHDWGGSNGLLQAIAAAHALQSRGYGAAALRLVHDVFGNPFRPLPAAPAGFTADVRALAAEEPVRGGFFAGPLDPLRLAVLADALEEAGCTEADLLGHLRSPGPHVRGCWALDLVLGKE